MTSNKMKAQTLRFFAFARLKRRQFIVGSAMSCRCALAAVVADGSVRSQYSPATNFYVPYTRRCSASGNVATTFNQGCSTITISCLSMNSKHSILLYLKHNVHVGVPSSEVGAPSVLRGSVRDIERRRFPRTCFSGKILQC
jgi:hypothetical protein